jgi:hypothetical protein
MPPLPGLVMKLVLWFPRLALWATDLPPLPGLRKQPFLTSNSRNDKHQRPAVPFIFLLYVCGACGG